MATTGLLSGVEVNNTILSYGVEAAYGVVPAVAFKQLRYISESLAGTKDRTAPQEVNSSREVSQSVTTKEQASGAINGALSFGTYDDFIAGGLCNSWQAAQVITAITTDISITAGATPALSSTLATKFQNLTAGQFIRLSNCANAANNQIYRIATKTDNSHLTLTPLSGNAVAETSAAGSLITVKGSTIMNSTSANANTLFIQKQFSSNKFLTYPGSYISGFTLSGSVGQFVTANFNVLAKQEAKATTNSSTGAVTAAPSGTVNNTVGNWQGIYFNETEVTAVIDQFQLQVTNQNAALQMGLGSSAAQGVLTGTLAVSGSFRLYFADFTQYDLFKSEATQRISFVTADNAGNAYVVTLLNGLIMNPQVTAQGIGNAVLATFNLEGAPQSGGGTIQFDRIAA